MEYEKERTEWICIFEDTVRRCERERELMKAVLHTRKNTVLYRNPQEEHRGRQEYRYQGKCRIQVVRSSALEEAARLRFRYPDDRIGLLIPVSDTMVGGNVIRGGKGTEEVLCRCTTLYPCLNTDALSEQFYRKSREWKDNGICIYLPDIVCIRADVMLERVWAKSERFCVDIFGYAGWGNGQNAIDYMNLLHHPENNVEDLEGKGEKWSQMEFLLQAAVEKGVDVLIINALQGRIACFSKDRMEAAMTKALKEYRHSFKAVIFVI